MIIVKNGCGQSGRGTQKCYFFHARMNSGKLKVDSIIFGWALPKIAMAFLRPKILVVP